MKPLPLESDSPADAPPRLSRGQKVVSLLLVLHVAAVFVAPLAVPPSSMLAGGAWSLFRPYLEAAFLNHGYKFFAPDPGPSHLVRYELLLADGSRREGVFPNLEEQQPRLLYHRHMMLSERLVGPPNTPWIDAYARSYARHLLEKHQARQVVLYLQTHYIPSPMDVAAGMRLNDPSLYEERRLLALDTEAP